MGDFPAEQQARAEKRRQGDVDMQRVLGEMEMLDQELLDQLELRDRCFPPLRGQTIPATRPLRSASSAGTYQL